MQELDGTWARMLSECGLVSRSGFVGEALIAGAAGFSCQQSSIPKGGIRALGPQVECLVWMAPALQGFFEVST